MTPRLYTVGDSHAWHAWLKLPDVSTNISGPMTMYAFGKGQPIVASGFPQDAVICYCWGEVDCRCHIHQHQPWQETVDRVVDRYLQAIALNADINPNVWLFNVVPPPRRHTVMESPGFPFVGSDAERLQYVFRMNDRLKQSGYPFVDVYAQYADADGFLLVEKSDGYVHIADEAPLRAWMDANLLSVT